MSCGKKKSSWELWWKKGDMPWQISSSFTSLRKSGLSHTHKSQPGQCYNPWLQNDVTCVCPTPLSPAGHEQRGQGCRTHTHTHTHAAKCANHGSRRQPSFSCQAWKQNRWEMKCWDWPDLVDDCRLNSWGWNWAFYTLAAAQDTICPSLEDNMAWVACHVKY